MPSFTLTPLPLSAPASTEAPVRVSFRVPASQVRPARNNKPEDPIFPATGLQLCVQHAGHEVFVERTTSREIEVVQESDESWECTFMFPGTDLPKFRPTIGVPGFDAEAELWLYAWKGERVLGKWRVGTLPGRVMRP